MDCTLIDTMITIVTAAAKLASVPPTLLLAICTVESNLNAHAVNVHDGGSASYGLCQIKSTTANWLGQDGRPEALLDAKKNATTAAKYLKMLLAKYDQPCAIAAYNAGTCRKNAKGFIRNIKYVRKVEGHKRIYDRLIKTHN